MENKNEVKEKVKKVLWKMFRLQTIIFIIAISIALSYYTYKFNQNKQLVFGVADTKLLLGLVVMFVWVMLFTVYLMLELVKKDKIIINQNEFIKGQNDTIINLLHQVKEKSNTIEENTEAIMEQNEENFDSLMNFNKNTREILLDGRRDNIV